MRTLHALILPFCMSACAAGESAATKDDTAVDDGSSWDELEDDQGAGVDDEDEKVDDGDGVYPPCGDEVVDGAACEGDWSTTTCVDADEAYWWCEDGAWTSEK